MRLDRASGYGVLALVYLAGRGGAAPAQVHQIAAATGVPLEYLRKLLGRLVRARLIHSVRGRHGGFHLAQPSDHISLLRVVEAIEGPIDPAAFFDDDLIGASLHGAAHQLQHWRSHAAEQVRRLLGQTTLADIVGP